MESLEIMSRVMFCPKCYEADRPNSVTYVVLYGSTSHEYFGFTNAVYIPKRLKGFTPHIITCYGLIDPTKNDREFFYDCGIACGVVGCDTKLVLDNETNIYHPQFNERIKVFTEKEYRALKKFTDTGYELEGLDDLT